MSGCEDLSPYALQVLGDSMEPELADGAIVVIDPGYPAEDGAFVVAEYRGETVLRQMVVEGGRRYLRPLNPAYPTVEVMGPLGVRGVVVQQTTRIGGRRRVKHYV
jgi:DNA polymerase V